MKKKGFTLIELLIVIGIISILAAIIFVAVDPARRLGEAKNAERWSSANSILNAILKYTVDNNGTLPATVSALSSSDAYTIGTGAAGNCSTACPGVTVLNPAPTKSNDCVSLADLVDQYISSIPIDPDDAVWDSAETGYFIRKSANGRITIGSCDPDEIGGTTPSINVAR